MTEAALREAALSDGSVSLVYQWMCNDSNFVAIIVVTVVAIIKRLGKDDLDWRPA